jgi:hypothetical protein
MSSYVVKIKMPQRRVKYKDVEFVVTQNKTKFGTVLISQGSIDWVPVGRSPIRVRWSKFDKLLEDYRTNKRGRP